MLTDILTAVRPTAVPKAIVSISTTSDDKIIGPPRASSIYSACMRQHVLGTIYKLNYRDVTGFTRQLTFDIGHAMHTLIQNSNDRYFKEQRRGHWKCVACGVVSPFGKPPTENCTYCGANIEALVYHEFELKIEKPYYVSGHPDLFIAPSEAPNKIRVVELKTMSGEKFKTLVAPLVEHVYQLHTYMWACGLRKNDLSIWLDDEVGYITYISKKEVSGELPIKTFTVNREVRVLKDIFDRLQQYKEGIEDNVIPEPLDQCVTSKFDHWRAKNCVARKLCKEYS